PLRRSARRRRTTLFPYTTLFRSQRHDAAFAQRRDLLLHPDPQVGLGDVGVAFRMAADPGDRDAVLLEQPALDDLERIGVRALGLDRKSTRLNSSHVKISYAVFCL